MGSANDWLNLYKAYECLLELFSEEDLKAKGWATGKDLELFRRNANYYHRHRYQPDIDPPSREMTVAEAASFLRQLVAKALDELSSEERLPTSPRRTRVKAAP
jgi:hypothetical protein